MLTAAADSDELEKYDDRDGEIDQVRIIIGASDTTTTTPAETTETETRTQTALAEFRTAQMIGKRRRQQSNCMLMAQS